MSEEMRIQSHNRGLAFIEILTILAVIWILGMFFWPLSTRHPEPARETTCMSNQRQIAVSIAMYAQDHKETLPLSSKVRVVLGVDIANMKCPAKKEFHNNYLYNNRVSGLNLDKLIKTADPAAILLTVDGKTTIGPKRMFEDIYYTPADVEYRHYNKRINIYRAMASFADGHVESLTKITEPESWDKVGIINPSNDKVKKK
jgi:prepilin-type processing-associated H-X9-DG protein